MSALEEELSERLKKLRPEQREQVLDYARSLEEGRGANRLRSELWRFRHTFTTEEAQQIKRIIEEDCERVDADGW